MPPPPPAPPDTQIPSNRNTTNHLNHPNTTTTVTNTTPTANLIHPTTADTTVTVATGDKSITNPNNKSIPSTSTSNIIPSQLKISSNFDRPQRQNEPSSEIPNQQSQAPPIPIKSQTTLNPTAQNPISSDMHQIRAPTGNNKVVLNSGSRGTDEGISNPSFSTTVQAKLPSLDNGTPTIEIRHDTHLGKSAMFFLAQDYFVTLT